MMLTHERLLEVLDYDPETGVFRWKVSPRGNVCAGDVAGCLGGRGYAAIGVDLALYRAHRLAWFYVTGEWPQGAVDHVNGRRDDNRFSNLRVVSNAINSQNLRRAHSDSRTGLLGVYPHKKSGRFQSRIMVGGARKHLGTFETAQEAHAAYLAAKRQLHPGNTL
jgi:hypothetical protein